MNENYVNFVVCRVVKKQIVVFNHTFFSNSCARLNSHPQYQNLMSLNKKTKRLNLRRYIKKTKYQIEYCNSDLYNTHYTEYSIPSTKNNSKNKQKNFAYFVKLFFNCKETFSSFSSLSTLALPSIQKPASIFTDMFFHSLCIIFYVLLTLYTCMHHVHKHTQYIHTQTRIHTHTLLTCSVCFVNKQIM